MIRIEHEGDRSSIVVRVSGTLTAKDYDQAIPELEHALEIAQAPLRMMIRLEDFHGWEIGALWRELTFDLGDQGDVGRIAVVGESELESWGTTLTAPFARAEMRFFPTSRTAEAEAWLARGPAARDDGA